MYHNKRLKDKYNQFNKLFKKSPIKLNIDSRQKVVKNQISRELFLSEKWYLSKPKARTGLNSETKILSIKIRHKTSIHYIPAVLGALPNAMTQEIKRKKKKKYKK